MSRGNLYLKAHSFRDTSGARILLSRHREPGMLPHLITHGTTLCRSSHLSRFRQNLQYSKIENNLPYNTQSTPKRKRTMVYLTTTPATLSSYARSCRAYLNTHRSGDVRIINELSAVCTELEELAAELDQHSLRLSYGNCSPSVLMGSFGPGVVDKLPAIDLKVTKAVNMISRGAHRSMNVAGSVKECFEFLKARAWEYERGLAAALTHNPNQAWGYEAKTKFLPKR